MLETLQIRNFALIDDVEVHFGNGFNVLTGETGAGKSIVVNALSLVLGARASSASVRSGERHAKIDAVFRLTGQEGSRVFPLLDEHGIEVPDGELHVSRIVSAEGRSRAYLNGSLVPVAVLSQTGHELVDLHGQHDHQSLLHTARQRELLDAFGGLSNAAESLANTVDQLRNTESELEQLERDDREQMRRIEFLEFEKSEIDAAELEPDEESRIRSQRDRAMNADAIRTLRRTVEAALIGDDQAPGAADLVSQALNALEELTRLDPDVEKDAQEVESVYQAIESLAENYRNDGDMEDVSPEELNALNARLSQLSDLKRKYGDTIEEILAYRDRIAQESAQWDQRDERLAALRADRDKLAKQAADEAGKLSKDRKRTGKRLDKAVTGVLQTLGMESGAFVTNFEHGELNRHGVDRISFTMSANAGEAPKPLKSIASGGEISRTMLAIKTVFVEIDPVEILIFDEIDTGVGGAVANQVGEAMAELAQRRQVLCVTHLASIAARADHHFRVSKLETAQRTKTRVTEAAGDLRVEEIARLLDGGISPASIEHARSLLGEVRKASA